MKRFCLSLFAVALGLTFLASSAAADPLDVQSVIFLKNVVRSNGVVIPNGYQWTVQVIGTGITQAQFENTSLFYDMPQVSTNTWEYSRSYADQASLDAEHPSSVSGVLGININNFTELALNSLNYSTTQPTAVPVITFPASGATGVSLNPNYQWNSLTGINALHMSVDNHADGSQPYLDMFDTNTSLTSWTPGSLSSNTSYSFDVTALNGTVTAKSLSGDSYNFYQVNGQSNSVDFTTQSAPEPMTLTLLGSGLVILFRSRRAA